MFMNNMINVCKILECQFLPSGFLQCEIAHLQRPPTETSYPHYLSHFLGLCLINMVTSQVAKIVVADFMTPTDSNLIVCHSVYLSFPLFLSAPRHGSGSQAMAGATMERAGTNEGCRTD